VCSCPHFWCCLYELIYRHCFVVPQLRELVALGALVNWAENDGWTALHFACANGHKEIVETLLKAGADAHYTNLLGKTPRDFARAAGNKEIVAIIDKFEAETAKEL
jgi:ankyrin repeat protein